MRPVAVPAHAVRAAPSHVVGAHSTESALLLQLEEQGTMYVARAKGVYSSEPCAKSAGIS